MGDHAVGQSPGGEAGAGAELVVDGHQAGSVAWAWRRRLMKSKREPEIAMSATAGSLSVSRRERASATVLVAPDLYWTEKSKPSSFLTQ